MVELGVVEQRYQAVLEVLAGASVTEVARRYGVARQTLHTWLRRYASDGLVGLVDRSSKPGWCPHQMPAEVEARVVELRRAHPGWGPRTIGYQLSQVGVVPVPSRSGIYRAEASGGVALGWCHWGARLTTGCAPFLRSPSSGGCPFVQPV